MDSRPFSNDFRRSQAKPHGWTAGNRKRPSGSGELAAESGASSSGSSTPATVPNSDTPLTRPPGRAGHVGHGTTPFQASKNPWGNPLGFSTSLPNSLPTVSTVPQAFQISQGSGPETSALQLDSSDDDSVSGGEEVGDGKEKRRAGLEDLEDNIFGRYLQGGGSLEADGQVFRAGLEKIRDQLLAGHSGGSRCLICLERIKNSESVWQCFKSCHCILHLPCIQLWARQSANAAAARAANENLPSLPGSDRLPGRSAAQLAAAAALHASWHCPKCRTDYSAKEVPKEYRCFCGKDRDPEFNPWLAPHSCGETCEKKLPGDCAHRCTLLCHPGPCPPCPQLIRSTCYCDKKKDLKRCGHHEFSCGNRCGRSLACVAHTCEAICHAGACPPCPKTSDVSCRCGHTSEIKSCAERDFSCGRKCVTMYTCGKHYCEKNCHKLPCGNCPLTGKRSCPCGKVLYTNLPCDRLSPPCGATCQKPLSCGYHQCPERCHAGPCADACRVVIAKRCRCGGLKKEVPCSNDLHCERRCQRQRNCGRHMCKRRCCDGTCPPCAEVCGKKLRCGNHKCPAPCHSGPCAPCPLTVRIACACNSTAFSVPCGAEREQRPPKCSKRCSISQLCIHRTACTPHRCHYGACPPCILVCNQELPSCGHFCPLFCHGPKPPPNPDYTLRPRKKLQARRPENSVLREGQPCPPCLAPMLRKCQGLHSGQEQVKPCSVSPVFSCHLPCGNSLACGNHHCQLSCHAVTVPRDLTGNPLPLEMKDIKEMKEMAMEMKKKESEGLKDAGFKGMSWQTQENEGDGEQRRENRELVDEGNLDIGTAEGRKGKGESGRHMLMKDTCQQCTLLCQKPREPLCGHPCKAACHLAPCEPCSVLLKRSCHCGAMVHVLDCHVWGRASPKEKQNLTSCKGPCHRKLPFCTHLCPQICHPGPCPDPAKCRKKVSVRCSCQRLKKEWLCFDVQSAEMKRYGQKQVTVGGRVAVGVGLLPCDEECARLERERRAVEEKVAAEQLRQRSLNTAKREALTGPSTKPRRRTQRNTASVEERQSWVEMVPWKWLLWGFYLLLLLLLLYGASVGLSRLSEWMNARDSHRLQRRSRTVQN